MIIFIKNGQRTQIDIPPSKENTNGKQVHEKVLNVTNDEYHASQNHNEISPHTCWDSYHQKTRDNKYWWGCEEKGTLVHCLWKCKLVQQLWKTVRKLKIQLLYDPAIAKVWKQRVSIKGRMDQKCGIHAMEYSALKKMEILTFVTTWMNLWGSMLSEMRHTEKVKYWIVSSICVFKKKWTGRNTE